MAKITMSPDDVGILADAYPDKVQWQRVSYDDGQLTVPDDFDPPISAVDISARRKAALLAYARSKRWQIETGGINVGGMTVGTDDRSKVLLQGARTSADKKPSFKTRWDTGDESVVLTAAQIIAISDAVSDHVNAVFDKFDSVKASIKSGSITTREAIDAAFAA